jgi:hypothetical protein
MTDEEIDFFKREKTKFDELIEKFGWTEEYLLNEVGASDWKELGK